MAFQKGQSGNPGGRPKECAEVTQLARDHSREAVERLVALMRQDEDKKLAKAACDSLLDRGLGKPVQGVELSGPDGDPVNTLTRIELVTMRGNRAG